MAQQFDYYTHDGDNQADAHQTVVDLFRDAVQTVDEILPEGRGKAIVIRYLEDASVRMHHEIDMLDSPGHPA